MSRPRARATIRYGLPDTRRVLSSLLAAGLADADGGVVVGAEPALGVLSRAGRPELAIDALARLIAALQESAADGGADGADSLRAALLSDRGFRARLLGVLGGSTVLGDHLIAHPDSWVHLQDEPLTVALVRQADTRRMLGAAVGLAPDAPRCTGTEGERAAITGPAAVIALRRAYRDRLVLIAAHDLAPSVDATLAQVPLPSVSRALTDLADATVQAALAVAAGELSPGAAPCRLSVIAMGKTGARELNYLSDVDVIFAADHPPPDGSTPGAVPTEQAMLATATQLASGLMRICQQVAWEVDANLRPEGAAGALVRTPDSHLSYYRRWAATWEFQALLKARPAAGCPEVGRVFLEAVRPLVWASSGRPSFVEDVQAMRRKVEKNIPEARAARELKLGRGGLRDVEFAVQLLQLVHGRYDERLRVTGTLSALRYLIRGGYVGRTDGAEMAAAYTFLRRAEHRLQLQRLRRTHLLPDNEQDMEWLARTDGYAAIGADSASQVFAAERLTHAATVRRLHEKLFYRPLLNAVAAAGASDVSGAVGDELHLSPRAAADRLTALGFTANTAVGHLQALTSGMSRRAAIQRTLLPVLLDTFTRSSDPDAGLLGYRRVSETLAETPWYLRVLRDEGAVAVRLAALLGESKYVGELLLKAPEVLRLLADGKALVATDPAVVAGALLARSARANTAQEAADSARSARRHELLRLACGDLTHLLDVHQVMAGVTSIAQATVAAAFVAAWRQIESERGVNPARMAVIGMGRLGGAELGYGSDADVVYVAEPSPGAGPDEVDAQLSGCVAVAELTARLLGRPSTDPALELDAGLRPEGRNGRLVRTLDSYRSYWERFAAPWERQALLRARPVAGDEELGRRFIEAADEVRYPVGGLSMADVIEIRRIKARVDTERLPRGGDPSTNTKLGSGGLADIEWTVQLLQLQHAAELPGLRTPATLPAIEVAVEAGLISARSGRLLRDGWISATRTRNAIMLVKGKPDDQIPRQGPALRAVARVMDGSDREGSVRLPGAAPVDPGEFVDEYRRTARHARKVVDAVFDGAGR